MLLKLHRKSDEARRYQYTKKCTLIIVQHVEHKTGPLALVNFHQNMLGGRKCPNGSRKSRADKLRRGINLFDPNREYRRSIKEEMTIQSARCVRPSSVANRSRL